MKKNEVCERQMAENQHYMTTSVIYKPTAQKRDENLLQYFKI
jgi:hypothetical protein